MILVLANGQQLRGDLIKSAVLRNDLAPVPETLEAEIRYDETLAKWLAEGQVLEAGPGNFHRIIKSELQAERAMQGTRPLAAWRITTLLEAAHPVGFVRRTAIIKRQTSLAAIYRACGCSIAGVDNDFAGGYFACLVGDTPSFHLARLLQEEGGVVRWRRGKLAFLRLLELKQQDSTVILPANAIHETGSGFLQRHEIPTYCSLAPDGSVIHGNRAKERPVVFVPGKDARQLLNMSRALVRANVLKVDYSGGYFAGDVVKLSNGERRVVMTVAHVYRTGTDGSGTEQYSRLWLGTVQA